MPLFEYKCSDCGLLFEELKVHGTEHLPCRKCGGDALKQVSSFSSVMSGGSSNETVDMTIGRAANEKWQRYHDRQSKRRGDRKLENVSVPRGIDGSYQPVMALGGTEDKSKRKEYVSALQTHRKERTEKGIPQFSGPGAF